MSRKKTVRIGTIRPEDVKARKKSAPPTRIQKSTREYDRKHLKEEIRKELEDE